MSYPDYVTEDRKAAWDALTPEDKEAIDKVSNPDRWIDVPEFNTPLGDDPCSCCAGATSSGWDTICERCKEAITKRDRSLHPHAPSPAQQALIEREGLVGGQKELTLQELPPGYAVIAMIESGNLDRYLGRIHAAVTKRMAEHG